MERENRKGWKWEGIEREDFKEEGTRGKNGKMERYGKEKGKGKEKTKRKEGNKCKARKEKSR